MIQELMLNFYLISIFILITSFLTVYYIIPRISWVITTKKLNDEPNNRSSHTTAIPTMAGISFFFTLIFTIFFIQYFDEDHIGLNLIASSTLILMVGVKDDLVLSTPKMKLVIEALAIMFLFFNSTLEATSLHGFLGIYEIPEIVAYLGSVLIALTIINSYNLIDGIDGLAAAIGIVVSTVFGVIFYTANQHFYFILCLSLIGMLSAYLIYNFSSKKKIFMGDTGSLLIGFCLAFLTLKFITIESTQYDSLGIKLENALIMVVAILCIPLFDLFRVVGVRLLNKKSLFLPDRNHAHHILIKNGMSHFRASTLLVLLNIVIVTLCVWLSFTFESKMMLFFLMMIFGLYLVLFNVLRKKSNQNLISDSK